MVAVRRRWFLVAVWETVDDGVDVLSRGKVVCRRGHTRHRAMTRFTHVRSVPGMRGTLPGEAVESVSERGVSKAGVFAWARDL